MNNFTTNNRKLIHNTITKRFEKLMGIELHISKSDHGLKKADSKETNF